MKTKLFFGLLVLIAFALADCAPVTVSVSVPAEPVSAGSTATAYVTLTCTGGEAVNLNNVAVTAITSGLTYSPSSRNIPSTSFTGSSASTTFQLTASSAGTYDYKITGTVSGESTPIDSSQSVTFTSPSSVFAVSYTVSPVKENYWLDEDEITVNAQVTFLGADSTLTPVSFDSGTGITEVSGTFEYSSYNFSALSPTANFQWVVQPSSTTPEASYITVSGYQNQVSEIESVIDSSPSVTLSTPASGGSTTDTTPSFTYLVTDTDNATVTCSLYVDGTERTSGSATADGVTTNTLTAPSALAVSAHTWYVSCTDGTHTGTSSTRSLTITHSQGGGSSSGGGSGGIPIEPGQEFQQTQPTAQEPAYYEQLISADENVQEALKEALGVETLSAETVSAIAAISSEVSAKSTLTTTVEHTDTGGSRLVLTAKYTGEKNLEGVVIVFTVPKSFASKADEVTVSTQPAVPSKNIVVVQSDPVYSIFLDSLGSGEAFNAFFDVATKVNRNTVKDNLTSPILLVEGYAKEPAAPPAKTVCGNSVREGTEECDGSAGVPAGYKCGSDCLLVKLLAEEVEPPAPPSVPQLPEAEEVAAGVGIGLIVLVVFIVVILCAGVYLLYSRSQPKKKK